MSERGKITFPRSFGLTLTDKHRPLSPRMQRGRIHASACTRAVVPRYIAHRNRTAVDARMEIAVSQFKGPPESGGATVAE